ncbi:hypothetical protein PQX77_004415 [Marasmius sp. AFHP31]|nr:hypothetical protein PQX77_004415 [Marasmius sp. AFHP31]
MDSLGYKRPVRKFPHQPTGPQLTMRCSLLIPVIFIGAALAAPSPERITQLLSDTSAAPNLFSPNITWTIFGGPFSGTHNYTSLMNVLSTVNDAISGTYKVDVVSVISEGAGGTRSSIELKAAEGTVGKNGMSGSLLSGHSRSVLMSTNVLTGIPYPQQFAWISEWEGETIISNREHLDSALADRFFGSK